MTISAICFGLWFPLTGAKADDPYASSDPQRREWFKSLKTNPQPNGRRVSCCDVADGFRVDAIQQGSQWFIKWGGQVYPVPPEVVIKDPPSIDGEAYAFFLPSPAKNGSLIRCFVPPVPGF